MVNAFLLLYIYHGCDENPGLEADIEAVHTSEG
jgi:hypothetical protein